jgi:hypothetical protein
MIIRGSKVSATSTREGLVSHPSWVAEDRGSGHQKEAGHRAHTLLAVLGLSYDFYISF